MIANKGFFILFPLLTVEDREFIVSSAKPSLPNQLLVLTTTTISYYVNFVKIVLIELKCSKVTGFSYWNGRI